MNNAAKGTILEKIATSVQARLNERKHEVPLSFLVDKIGASPVPLSVISAFRPPGPHIIAEIKRNSPAVGALALDADPIAVARQYLDNGATVVSVLTEPEYFHGDLEFLRSIRGRFPQSLLLMKDFILEEYQLVEGRLAGANAVLLMASLLTETDLRRMFAYSRLLGLTALVEVHDEAELALAVDLGAELIGVNNRNLRTMEVSLDVSRRLAPLAPKGRVLICESGIRTGREIRELHALGFSGFLVGTALMDGGSATSPGEALARLKAEAM